MKKIHTTYKSYTKRWTNIQNLNKFGSTKHLKDLKIFRNNWLTEKTII